MVCGSSLFSQSLGLVDRQRFRSAVRKHETERYSKGFSSWDQFVSMLFGQFAQCQSLREICCGLAGSVGKLQHFGMEGGPKRSTLAYANKHRSWRLYESVFHSLLKSFQGELRGTKKFRFRNKLYSLDGSLIDLCATAFPWAKYSRTKGAVKLHLLLDHDGYLPVLANIDSDRTAEVKVARTLEDLEAEHAHQDVCWDESQRVTNPDLDSTDRVAVGQVHAASLETGMVDLEPRRDASNEPSCLQGSMDLAGRPLPKPGNQSRSPAGFATLR